MGKLPPSKLPRTMVAGKRCPARAAPSVRAVPKGRSSCWEAGTHGAERASEVWQSVQRIAGLQIVSPTGLVLEMPRYVSTHIFISPLIMLSSERVAGSGCAAETRSRAKCRASIRSVIPPPTLLWLSARWLRARSAASFGSARLVAASAAPKGHISSSVSNL